MLVVLQAIDAAGKDGTIRHVMSGVNPQGVVGHELQGPVGRGARPRLPLALRAAPARSAARSASSTARTTRRCSSCACTRSCSRGRSCRRRRAAEDVWKRRYREINDWERYLVDNGFRIVKLFLNLSKEEQRQRFLARIDEPEKNWKFSAADVEERRYWDDYQRAFSEMLSHTSTEWAPWHVIPADRKWFARLAVSAVIANALMAIDPQYPTPSDEDRAALAEAKTVLEAEAPAAG